jgi:hypothetical protein
MSTDGDSTLSNTIDKLVPVTSDGIPIIWTDDNDAHIEGASEEGQAKSCAISRDKCAIAFVRHSFSRILFRKFCGHVLTGGS